MVALDSNLIAKMTDWRHHMHRFPECGFEVNKTSDFIADKLASFGIEVVRNIGDTGLVGILRNGDGAASIGLRADMDALQIHEKNLFDYRSQHEGKMHACGHDGHCAMLLGAAYELAHSRQFSGTAYFIFQPDEEHGQGAQAMINDGLFERFPMDAVYGLHNMPGLPAGTFTTRPGSIMASETSFEIVIDGIGGHAAMPHMGVDPLLTAAHIIVALQTIVSRNLSAIHETAVVSATELLTNGTVNVIPSQVTIKGDCRCFTESALKKIEESMERIVAGICQSTGAQYRFKFVHAFFPTINHFAETQHAIKAAEAVFGRDQVFGRCDPFTISEDFSSMLRIKPGCYSLLGNGIASVGGCALHNPTYDFNDGILEKGARYWVTLVRDQLKQNASAPLPGTVR